MTGDRGLTRQQLERLSLWVAWAAATFGAMFVFVGVGGFWWWAVLGMAEPVATACAVTCLALFAGCTLAMFLHGEYERELKAGHRDDRWT